MTNTLTALLGVLSGDVKAMNEKVDVLCSHSVRLGDIESDVAAISGTVQALVKTVAVSSFVVLCLNEHLDDIRLVVEHKASEEKRQEEKQKGSRSQG